jgi:hypothetical protein
MNNFVSLHFTLAFDKLYLLNYFFECIFPNLFHLIPIINNSFRHWMRDAVAKSRMETQRVGWSRKESDGDAKSRMETQRVGWSRKESDGVAKSDGERKTSRM